MPRHDMLKLCNKYSPLVFLKKLEKVKITGECFVNLKIIDDAFALVNFQCLWFLKIHLGQTNIDIYRAGRWNCRELWRLIVGEKNRVATIVLHQFWKIYLCSSNINFSCRYVIVVQGTRSLQGLEVVDLRSAANFWLNCLSYLDSYSGHSWDTVMVTCFIESLLNFTMTSRA